MLLFVCEIVIVNCKNITSHQDKDNSPLKFLFHYSRVLNNRVGWGRLSWVELLYRWQYQQYRDDIDENKIISIGKMVHPPQINLPFLHSCCISCSNIIIASGARGVGGWSCYIDDSSSGAVTRRWGFEKSDGWLRRVMARSYWPFFCRLEGSKLFGGMAGDSGCRVTMLRVVGGRKGGGRHDRCVSKRKRVRALIYVVCVW
jgi:hypothetical protein